MLSRRHFLAISAVVATTACAAVSSQSDGRRVEAADPNGHARDFWHDLRRLRRAGAVGTGGGEGRVAPNGVFRTA